MCVQVLSHGHGHVFERESKHMLRCCTLMCLCVCVRVCHQVHEHVCVHERECMVQVHVCGHVCMCVWHICRAPPWTHEARDSPIPSLCGEHRNGGVSSAFLQLSQRHLPVSGGWESIPKTKPEFITLAQRVR